MRYPHTRPRSLPVRDVARQTTHLCQSPSLPNHGYMRRPHSEDKPVLWGTKCVILGEVNNHPHDIIYVRNLSTRQVVKHQAEGGGQKPPFSRLKGTRCISTPDGLETVPEENEPGTGGANTGGGGERAGKRRRASRRRSSRGRLRSLRARSHHRQSLERAS